MRYYLCCPKCGCKGLKMDENSYYVCEDCGESTEYDNLYCEEE